MIALPALESFGFRRFASAASTAPIAPSKRCVFLSIGFGVTKETWFPDQATTGSEYQLSESFSPLTRHQSDITVVQGCSNQFSNEAHWEALSGSPEPIAILLLVRTCRTVSRLIRLSPEIWDKTLASLQFNSTAPVWKDTVLVSPWHGINGGKPIAGQDDPVQVFHKLFSPDNMPLEQRQAAIAENRSVLDAVVTQAKRVQRGLTKTDTDKLDEYFQGIRDIETRLQKEEAWLEIPKAKPPLEQPEEGLKGVAEIEIMQDLIVAALQTDSTRVLSYRMPGQSLLQSLNLKPSRTQCKPLLTWRTYGSI